MLRPEHPLPAEAPIFLLVAVLLLIALAALFGGPDEPHGALA
jgi:hypothetical protein